MSPGQLCLEALIARRALKDYNPWKAIDALWGENRDVDPTEMEKRIFKALKE